MILAPVMSKDIKLSRAKINQIKIVEQNLNIQKSTFIIIIIIMKPILIFILLIYWSIIISAPVMSNDFKLSRAKINKTQVNKLNVHH